MFRAMSTQYVSILQIFQIFFPQASKASHSQLSKRFHSISERVFSKHIKKKASISAERRRSKISKKKFRTNTKKNSSTQKKDYFQFI